MKKKLFKISLFLILALTIVAFSTILIVVASSDNTTESITLDDSTFTATITGVELSSKTKEFSIPDKISNGTTDYKVVAIGEKAFSGNTNVFGKLTIPEGVTSIGASAFNGTYIYGDVIIPSTVSSIGSYAFEKCHGIMSVTLPEQITVLSKGIFSECFALSSVNTENIETFEANAFYKCKALHSITISEVARKIGSEVFYECDSLSGHFDLSKIETIDVNAFYNCPRITEFTVPDTVHDSRAYNTCLGVEAFHATDNNVVFSSSDGVLYSKNGNTICTYPSNKPGNIFELGESVTVIAKRAFLNAKNLEKIVLTDNVTTIMAEAFSGSAIKTAYIPDNIESVNVDVFKNCTKLEWVVFGSNVIAVGCDSLKSTPSLKYVFAKNPNLPKIEGSFKFIYTKDYTCTDHFYGHRDLPATCIEPGYNACVVCNKLTYVNSLGHTGAVLESVPLSCTSDAYRKVDCMRCNQEVVEITEKTPGHISNGVVAYIPASFKSPSFSYSSCIVCNKMYAFDYYADFSIIGDVNCDGKINESDLTLLENYLSDSSTDISTANADILRDGKIDDSDVITLKSYLLGLTTELPTRTINCTNHGRKGTIEIASASCQVDGFRIRYCLNCGILTDEIFEGKLDHKLVEEKVIYPSCATTGQVVSSCTVCSKKVYTTLNKRDHAHNWYTISSQRGYEYSTCSICGTFESRIVDYSAFDSLIGQIPKHYSVYYSTETVVLLEPIMSNYKLTLTQAEVDKNVRELTALIPQIQYKVLDVPVIFIDADTIDANDYHDAKIIVAYKGEDGKTQVEAIDYNSEIKIRGNSTAKMSKKPYNFKFSSKVDLFGMGSGKKYALLANAIDDTFIKNALTFELSYQIGSETNAETGVVTEYLPTCKYEIVDVYCNGKYSGAYMLTTPVEVGDDRVEIDENYDYLLEIEKEGAFTDPDCIYLKSPLFNVNFLVESPEVEDLSAESLSNLRMMISHIDFSIMSGDWDLIQKYVDVESVARYFILHDILKEVDIVFDSTRFFIKNDGENHKLYGGPAWDFDRAMFISKEDVVNDGGGTAFGERNYYFKGTEGAIENDTSTGVWASLTWLSGENNNNDRIWFCSLYKHSPDFVKLICQRVSDLSAEVSILYESQTDENGKVTQKNIIDSIIYDEKIADSLRRNREEHNVADFNKKVEAVREWLKNRYEWMQGYYSYKLDILNSSK